MTQSGNFGDKLKITYIAIDEELSKKIDNDVRAMLKAYDMPVIDAYKVLSLGFTLLGAVVAKNMDITEETYKDRNISYEVMGMDGKSVYGLLCSCTELTRPVREGLKDNE